MKVIGTRGLSRRSSSALRMSFMTPLCPVPSAMEKEWPAANSDGNPAGWWPWTSTCKPHDDAVVRMITGVSATTLMLWSSHALIPNLPVTFSWMWCRAYPYERSNRPRPGQPARLRWRRCRGRQVLTHVVVWSSGPQPAPRSLSRCCRRCYRGEFPSTRRRPHKKNP